MFSISALTRVDQRDDGALFLVSVLPDPDPPSDGGGPLAPLFARGGSLLPPPARGLLPGRPAQAEEDLRLEPEAGKPGPTHGQHHPVPAAEAASGLLPPPGSQGGIPASAEEVDTSLMTLGIIRLIKVLVRRKFLFLKAAVLAN